MFEQLENNHIRLQGCSDTLKYENKTMSLNDRWLNS